MGGPAHARTRDVASHDESRAGTPAPASAAELRAASMRALQRRAGNRAVSALCGPVVQRTLESAAKLTELAKPKVLTFETPQIELQVALVNELERTIGEQSAAATRLERELKEPEEHRDDLQSTLMELLSGLPDDEEVELDAKQLVEQAALEKKLTELGVEIEKAEGVVSEIEDRHKVAVDRRDRWSSGVMVLGAVKLDTLPEDDHELLRTAKLVDLPKEQNSLDNKSVFDLVGHTGMADHVVKVVLGTMIAAGQIAYLRKSKLIDQDWSVTIEVHYYRSREQSRSQFHQDTLGQTLFVNLNYHSDHEIAGAEYLQHPPTVKEHEERIASSLPQTFRDDLASVRKGVTEPTKIKAPMVPAYGALAFVDETIFHMTPLRGHRTVTGQGLSRYLERTYTGTYSSETHPPTEQWEQLQQMRQKSSATYIRPDLLKAGLTHEQINELLSQEGDSGFQTVSIPHVTRPGQYRPLERKSKQALIRQMSKRALKKGLPQAVTGERRFFRTWVRAVRKTK